MIRSRQAEFDVAVIGGGMAGICAALASARSGAKTALIQSRSVLGGNASEEIRMHIVGAGCSGSKPNMNESGILLELLLENKSRNPYQNYSIWESVLWEKVRFQENLTLYLNTCAQEVRMCGSRIEAVICCQSTTETCHTIAARVFIDATGHGTVGVLAGAASRVGSEGRQEFSEPTAPEKADTDTMGDSLLFKAVDRGRPVPFVKPDWAYAYSEYDLRNRTHDTSVIALADGGEHTSFVEGRMNALPEYTNVDAGYWWIELGGQYDDIIESAEEIRDELLRCLFGVWDHLKNRGDHGVENYDLEWFGMVPGHRESRRLEGDYLINENDIRANRVFPDAVAYGGWPMDVHIRDGIKDLDHLPSRVYNFEGVYTIPYRSYYSRNIRNLMMCGRDVSCTKMAFSSMRVMGTCAVGGQAAGTAAAIAVREGIEPREVADHMDELQQTLLRDDCFIPGFRNTDPADLARSARISASGETKGCEAENVINGVARTVGDEQNCWQSPPLDAGPQTLTLTWEAPQRMRQIRLTFDPDLTRDIMPTIMANKLARQCEGVPPALVRDYTVRLLRGGKQVWSQTVTGNVQRLNVLELPSPAEADVLEIAVTAAGIGCARIFEVRAYA